jgi:hypothetical protein
MECTACGGEVTKCPACGRDLTGLATDRFPTDRELKYFRLFRDRIDMEDELTNHRMSWLIYTQTVLIVLWAGAYDKALLGIGFLACIVGIVSCVIVFFGLLAAQNVITELKTQYKSKYPQNDEMLPNIVGGAKSHLLGKWAPYSVPILFVLVWCVLVGIVLCRVR